MRLRRWRSVAYVVVGFRVDRGGSVYHRRCETVEELVRAVAEAFEERGAQLISIRSVVRTFDGWC